jgi:hypothetical protein
MAEFMVVNPRHRRRRKARSARRTRTTRRRRRRTLVRAANPRRIRRRRHVRARRSTRRRRHNPRGVLRGGGSAITILKHASAGVVGAAVAEIAHGFISKYLPANLQSGPTGLAVRGAVGIVALPMLLKMTPLRRFAPAVAAGAAFVILWDAYQQYIKPSLPLHGFGVYTPEDLGVYGGGQLAENATVAGFGFGQDSMYSDSMYT